MPDPDLSREIGQLLRAERGARNLTQQQFAGQTGMTQQRLSRIERGTVAPTTATVQRLFAAMGLRLRVTAAPLEAELDEQIDRLIGTPDSERLAELDRHAYLLGLLDDAVPYVFTGRLAAFLQGAPVPVDLLEIAVADADLDLLGAVLGRLSCVRLDARWRAYCDHRVDPRAPGPMQWLIGPTELVVEVAQAPPAALAVQVGDRTVRVRPLAEIEARDEELGRLMRRVRARCASAAAPVAAAVAAATAAAAS